MRLVQLIVILILSVLALLGCMPQDSQPAVSTSTTNLPIHGCDVPCASSQTIERTPS